MKNILYILLSLAVIAVSCKKDDVDEQTKSDDKIITDYLSANSLTATKHESGLYYMMTKEGTGGSPNLQDTVIVNYTGYLTNGTVFDKSADAMKFPLGKLIVGWQIGIGLMKSGGRSTLFIPSRLGYGSQQVGDIPANSVLIFDVELVEFY